MSRICTPCLICQQPSTYYHASAMSRDQAMINTPAHQTTDGHRTIVHRGCHPCCTQPRGLMPLKTCRTGAGKCRRRCPVGPSSIPWLRGASYTLVSWLVYIVVRAHSTVYAYYCAPLVSALTSPCVSCLPLQQTERLRAYISIVHGLISGRGLTSPCASHRSISRTL